MRHFRVCAFVMAVSLGLVTAFSEETDRAPVPRPEKFLLLLKAGDKISYRNDYDHGGYHITVISEDVLKERLRVRVERETEIKSLSDQVKKHKEAAKSDNADQKLYFENFQRLSMLQGQERISTELGEVVFVGQDYIAIKDVDEDHETNVPGWRITSIGRSKKKAK
jgi:hypothetical protein